MSLSERYKKVCDSMDIEFASRRENLDEAVGRLIEACVQDSDQHEQFVDGIDKALADLKSAIAALWFSWWAISSVNRTVRKDNTCELNCSEYKHEVIGGGCYCATDWGWIRAGQVARVVAKMKEKCEPEKKSRRRR